MSSKVSSASSEALSVVEGAKEDDILLIFIFSIKFSGMSIINLLGGLLILSPK